MQIAEIKDYQWTEAATCAHAYLLKSLKRAFSEMNISKTSNILDAGCGGGFILNELFKSGRQCIWGFDVSESGIKVAKQNYEHIGNRVAVHNAYLSELPALLPANNYDVTLSIEVIEHMYYPRDYLKNLHHWLKKEGFLILTTPYHGYFKNLVISLSNKFDKHFNPLWDGGHIKFFSKKTLCKVLKETGFEPIKFYGSGRLPLFWKSMVIIAKKI